ncbi:MAG: ATP-dependent helicase HrpB [Thermoguttaceae bacterium]
MPAPLPIDEVLPQIVAALRTSRAIVLRAPTGAGKTTRVPPALLDAGLASRGSIVVLQPRRLTARACARRIALERGAALGDEVGYQVRFDRCMSPKTRLQVVTEGIFLRMLQDDPFLESVAAVVFDEFHERSLNSDLALAMVRRVQETVRPELKLVVMSATLAAEPIAHWLGDCPVVESQGRLHPVEIRYVEDLRKRTVAQRAADAVEQILSRTPGDVLVFLPGVGEIRQTARRLESTAAARNLAVLPLYGDLPADKQDEVLGPIGRRKIVLSTNVAETSLTIEGITAVVDTGLARSLFFDPHVGMDRLQLAPISRASADQRAGRAGRTQPGVCLRLWAERTHRQRPAGDEPEIRRLDLAGPILELRVWGETDLQAFPWFEAPPAVSLEQADALLKRLGALDAAGNVTLLGRSMARLPVSPRLARMLLEGHRLGQAAAVALAAALLGERDPFGRGEDASPYYRAAAADSDSDVYDRVAALEEYAESGRADSLVGRIHRTTAQFVLHVRDQLLRELRQAMRRNMPSHHAALRERERGVDNPAGPGEAVRRGLLAAFPDRLVRRSGPGSRFGRMVGGRGVRVIESSAVRNAPLFLAVDVDRGESEALVRQASAVERQWLPADQLVLRTEVEFEATNGRVIARRRVYWEDLLLEESPAALPDGDEVATILAAAAAQSLDTVFPWDDAETADYVNRVRCLAQWMPELELPAFDAPGLQAVLPQVCRGCRSLDELRKAPWLAHLQAMLTQEQQRVLAHEAPERIEVPSGSRIKLHYESGKPPVLAVRIQEIFGMLETPRVAGRRVPVLLHLLAPNHRPQQVTDDLASFWRTTYHQVRKDLRRRYPKHAWPEDPYQAAAERRPGRKGP